MPIKLDDLESALIRFRLDVIEALATIDIEIIALQEAVQENKPITPARLKDLRADSQKILHKFRDNHAQGISPAHQLR